MIDLSKFNSLFALADYFDTDAKCKKVRTLFLFCFSIILFHFFCIFAALIQYDKV